MTPKELCWSSTNGGSLVVIAGYGEELAEGGTKVKETGQEGAFGGREGGEAQQEAKNAAGGAGEAPERKGHCGQAG